MDNLAEMIPKENGLQHNQKQILFLLFMLEIFSFENFTQFETRTYTI